MEDCHGGESRIYQQKVDCRPTEAFDEMGDQKLEEKERKCGREAELAQETKESIETFTGNRKRSSRKLAKEIENKRGKKYDHSTIFRYLRRSGFCHSVLCPNR